MEVTVVRVAHTSRLVVAFQLGGDGLTDEQLAACAANVFNCMVGEGLYSRWQTLVCLHFQPARGRVVPTLVHHADGPGLRCTPADLAAAYRGAVGAHADDAAVLSAYEVKTDARGEVTATTSGDTRWGDRKAEAAETLALLERLPMAPEVRFKSSAAILYAPQAWE